jgi:hypothetical protein
MDSVNHGEPNSKCSVPSLPPMHGGRCAREAVRQRTVDGPSQRTSTVPLGAPQLSASRRARDARCAATYSPSIRMWRRSGGVDEVRQMDGWRRRREEAHRGSGGSECGGGA